MEWGLSCLHFLHLQMYKPQEKGVVPLGATSLFLLLVPKNSQSLLAEGQH